MAFDFPAHGESAADGEHLTVSDCLESLSAAETELRTAAPEAEMLRLLRQMTASEADTLQTQGWISFDCDYVRPLKRTKEFFEVYRKGMAELMMVHGNRDETASPEAAQRFAEKADAELVMLPGGDHRLSHEGMPETVLRLARTFFLK